MKHLVHPLACMAVIVSTVTPIAFSPDTNDQEPSQCLLGNVTAAQSACLALSIAYAGDVLLSNDTSNAAYTRESHGTLLSRSGRGA